MKRSMPRKSRFKLPPLNLGGETFGQRLARIRKERGFTQVELAEKVGIIQALVSEYERDRVRLHAEMLVRFAMVLGVSADELLGMKQNNDGAKAPRRVLRRLQAIAKLPEHHQRALLKTIDIFLKGAVR